MTFSAYKQLEEAYVKEEVFPLDLKNSVANQLNKVCFCFRCILMDMNEDKLFPTRC